MRLGQDVLSDFEAATARAMAYEWLLTNAVGGAAYGTASGAHTRRSHALLLAKDREGRAAISLLKLDERLHVGGESFDLGCNLIVAPVPEVGTPGAVRPALDPAPLAGGSAGASLFAQPLARPAGHLLLEAFDGEPWPTWRWRVGGVVLEKTLFLLHTHHAVVVTYRQLEGPPARLSVTPLVASRAPDRLQRVDDSWRGAAQAVPGRVHVETSAGGMALSLWHNGAFMPARVWLRGLVYPGDRENAPPADARRMRKARQAPGPPAGAAPDAGPETDAAFVPGYLDSELASGSAFHLVASIERDLFRALAVEGLLGAPPPGSLGECVALLERGESDRLLRWRRAASTGAEVTTRQAAAAHRARDAAAEGPGGPRTAGAPTPPAENPAPTAAADAAHRLAEPGDPWLSRLSRAVLDGLVERDGRLTLLTSLPAGEERGSDTLRALPSLISLRTFEPAREVLRGSVEYLTEGLAPERFEPGTHRPRYGDPAVALWLIHAAELLVRRSEDLELLGEHILPAAESIVQAYRAGTRHGVRVGSDALLWAGEGAEACCRTAHNVLWFHALVATAQLARLAGRKEKGAFYLSWAREHQGRVIETLWDDRHGCLFEARDASGVKAGLTASQILAVSLAPPLLPPDHAARLVTTVERELVTPFGLRAEPGAVDAAPAWLGPFITAHLRVHQRSAEAQARAHAHLDPLRARCEERSVIHVPEAFAAPRRGDGAAPRTSSAPEALPAQGSVLAAAELLRVWIEELDRSPVPTGVA
jgi:hypothetical protein